VNNGRESGSLAKRKRRSTGPYRRKDGGAGLAGKERHEAAGFMPALPQTGVLSDTRQDTMMVPVTDWLSSIQNRYFPALLKVMLRMELASRAPEKGRSLLNLCALQQS
jgi:hypothetical protein